MIDFAAIPTYLDDLMNGLWVTLALTGLTMFFGITLIVVIYVLTDIMYALADPRIRYRKD